MQRRELFSSLASSMQKPQKQEKLLRPPYCKDESLFHNECSKCDAKCAAVCEEDIIRVTTNGAPYIQFSLNGCTYCDKCADVCEYEVLNTEDKKQLQAIITIDEQSCLSWSHTMCFACKDPCLDKAIDFQAMFMPRINENCTSCGFCISRCPTNAIQIKVI